MHHRASLVSPARPSARRMPRPMNSTPVARSSQRPTAGRPRSQPPTLPAYQPRAPKISTVCAANSVPSSAVCGGVAARRLDELRQEGEEEQRHLGVDGVGDEAAHQVGPQRRRIAAAAGLGGEIRARAAQRLPAEPDQVGRAGHLEGKKRGFRGGDQRGDAERGPHRVGEAAQRAAEAEADAGMAAARQAEAQHGEVVRAGGQGDQRGGEQEAGDLGKADVDDHRSTRSMPPALARAT
jgi:hypothetical protein